MLKHNFPNKSTCSICGDVYAGYGNNAQPVNDGRCCDNCNSVTVIPRRLADLHHHLRSLGLKRQWVRERLADQRAAAVR